MERPQFVFIFGTLKKGFPLHRRGLAHAAYFGPYGTAANYPMLVAGPWFAPMMFHEPGSGLRVSGELYAIDPATLERLDRMESIGKPGNFRRRIRVVPRRHGCRCEAFAYFKARFLAAPVHTGYLRSYEDRRFVPPWRRGM
ncbi:MULTISPECIES: gamma-glutamylcyclotransferase family protein [Sinorhizobium]|uniref:Gamma-glutamylcyclotransferase family protein n=1 Tax=Sinorhizobium americanum TaxID=194963 RepID=A0A2S3YMY3_9HYPH|nr:MULTISPECIES: gamma-glutamylcyclotransferase family protein [Sinorhizobium]POH30431.1 hypothetical protein ATY31_17325 [Sinorhizobium americanum]